MNFYRKTSGLLGENRKVSVATAGRESNNPFIHLEQLSIRVYADVDFYYLSKLKLGKIYLHQDY